MVDADVEVTQRLSALVTGLEIGSLTKVKCYPNPAENHLMIEIPENLAISSIEICSVTGKALYRTDVRPHQYWLKVDLSSYPSSLLFIRASNNGNIVSIEKIIKD